MRPQNIVIALAIIAGSIGLTAVVERPVAPAQQLATIQQVAPAEIDFAALHREASEALDNLRWAQRRRAQTSTAAY